MKKYNFSYVRMYNPSSLPTKSFFIEWEEPVLGFGNIIVDMYNPEDLEIWSESMSKEFLMELFEYIIDHAKMR